MSFLFGAVCYILISAWVYSLGDDMIDRGAGRCNNIIFWMNVMFFPLFLPFIIPQMIDQWVDIIYGDKR